MKKITAYFRGAPGARVRALAHFGAGAAVLIALGCGSTMGPSDSDGGDGGSSGGSGSGGTASGGTGTGGGSTGGAPSGGAPGGGGSGGVEGITNACPGTSVVSGTYPACRSQADCGGGFCQASAPNLDGICGACFPSPMECTQDSECVDGEVCVPGPDVTCQCMGPGLVCAPACTSDSCGEGEVCGDDGHCGPASCMDDAYACVEGTVCDPERAGDAHGCTPSLCDTDGYACSESTLCDAARAGDAHHCVPRSCDSEDYTCAEGMVCDPAAAVDAHGCRYVHCSEGATCPENHDCQADAAGTGCVKRACVIDADCDCGACITGRCEKQLFVCVVLPA